MPPDTPEFAVIAQRGKRLEYFTIGWNSLEGLGALATGLIAGSIPLLAGLVLSRLDIPCGADVTASMCTALSFLIGAPAGIVIAVREAQQRGKLISFLTAGSIAALAGSLGCVRLGVVSLVSVLVGIAIGTVLGGIITERASR